MRPVFNKMDALPDAAAFQERIRLLYPDALCVTTMRTDGVEPLKALLRARARTGRPLVTLRLPAHEGATIASLYRDGEVLARREHDGVTELDVRLEAWQVGKWKERGAVVEDEREVGRRSA